MPPRVLFLTTDYPPDLALRMGIAGIIGLVLLALSHLLFQRMQGSHAQEL